MLTVALGVCAASPSMAGLVHNGGFEDGASGWATTMNVYQPAGDTHSGTFSASTGCQGHECVSTLGVGAFIGQTLTTTAGGVYDLSFWGGETGDATSELSVFWNGVQIADILNPANGTLPTSSHDGMAQYIFTGLSFTSARTYFEIHGRQDPSFMYFDDVSVDVQENGSVTAVSEPASLVLYLAALALFALQRTRIRCA